MPLPCLGTTSYYDKSQQQNAITFEMSNSIFLSFKKCVAYTGNNMRKQTPVADKKEKDVSEPLQMCVVGSPVFSFVAIFYI